MFHAGPTLPRRRVLDLRHWENFDTVVSVSSIGTTCLAYQWRQPSIRTLGDYVFLGLSTTVFFASQPSDHPTQ
jgi:hypothetical protein